MSLAEVQRQYRAQNAGELLQKISTGEINLADLGVEAKASLLGEAYESELIPKGTGLISEDVDLALRAAADIQTKPLAQGESVRARLPYEKDVVKMEAAEIEDTPDFEAAYGQLSDGSKMKVKEIRELSGPAKAAEITRQAVESSKAETVEAAAVS